VAEALRQVPGAAVVRGGGSGGQTSLFLRGGESDYVKVLIDGVPVNDPGGAFDFASLSTDQVERIEVVRGPVSVLYGSDAVAGVVQVFTRRGSGQPRISAELTGGTGRQRYPEGERFTLYDAEASVAGAAGPVSYVAGGGREYSEGVYPLNNEHALHTGNLRLAWRPVGDAELALTSRLSDARSHFPTDGAGNIVDANAYLDRRLWSTAVQGGWQPAERIDVRFQLGRVARDQSSVDAPDGPADTTGVFASTLDFDGVRRLADARINARVLRGTFTAGVSREAAKATTAYTSESSYGPTEARGDYERGTTGYYVQLLSRPLEPLSLTLGGRLDDSDTYDTFETYRVGAALALAEGLRLRGALGRAFREPTFAEAFGSGFGDVGNPGLRPERSRSRELGADYEIGLATLAGTWFHQEFDQLIQYTFSPPAADDPNYFNVGAARSSGLELEARAVTGRWSGEASYSRVETEVLDPGLASDATFAEGEPLLRRPAHSGTLATRYTGATATLAVTVNAVGAREDVDFSAYPAARVELPAYATLDVAADYLLPLAVPTRLLLRIDNLFDADYRAMAGFPAPGRLVRLGARVRTR
ncbi:MAG: TonB-dependent receptor plug domain-containing protein, partial [Gemmatimonadota bacterium]